VFLVDKVRQLCSITLGLHIQILDSPTGERMVRMPLVLITRKPGVSLTELLSMIRLVVADELSSNDPHGALIPDDIEVNVREFGPLDISKYDVEILIVANEYPERRATLPARTYMVRKKVANLLPGGLLSWVWILLATGEWQEFQT